MIFYLSKLMITAALIVLITEVAKLSDKFGGLITVKDMDKAEHFPLASKDEGADC